MTTSALQNELRQSTVPDGEVQSAETGRQSGPWYQSVLMIVAAITVPRVVLAWALSAATTRSAPVGTPGPTVRGAAAGLLNWDAAHYLSIAEHGYRSVLDAPFFPLQPILAHGIGLVIGYPNATIAVSWIALAFATWGIFDVANRLTSRKSAIAATVLFAWGPASVFLVTGYAQALFMACTIWSLRFCLEKRWFWAAILAAGAGAVVPQGALVGVVVVVGILLAERGLGRVVLAIVCGIISQLGLIAYALYSKAHFGNALEFEKAGSTYWHDALTYPLHSFFVDVRHSAAHGGLTSLSSGFILLVDEAACLVAVGVLVGVIALWAKDFRWTLPMVLYVLGVLLNLSVIDAWGDGEARFISGLVTVYLVAAAAFERLGRRSMWPVVAVIAPLVAIGIYIEVQFHMAYWIT